MDDDITFDYSQLVDEAMRDVVAQVLAHVQVEGLSGDHHFFISFNTQFPGVSISPQLHSSYPEEMTVVIQHQFWDLDVHPNHFSIMLSFNNVPEKLVIPFDALTGFSDPSVKFGLSFQKKPALSDDDMLSILREDSSVASFEDASRRSRSDAKPAKSSDDDKDNVVSLDAFRNN